MITDIGRVLGVERGRERERERERKKQREKPYIEKERDDN